MTIDKDSFYNIAYAIINALYNANLPIVFKGMTVTRLALIENNISFSRETRDIDGDWTGDRISLSELEKVINDALSNLNNIYVKAFRDYSDRTSAGFDIYQNEIKISSFDLSIRKNEFVKLYDVNGIRFYGQTINKMIADKITVISTNKVFRRSKDLLDLYYLSTITNISKNNIIDIISKCNNTLGNFNELINSKKDVEHAYNSMYWIENKPSFEDVYDCCINIAKKFIK